MSTTLEEGIKAVILDLDGVITSTAKLHIRAWKQIFDEFLKQLAYSTNSTFIPLDPELDYRTYIDGRPRYEGAEAFLLSRNIKLPFGNPSDPPDTQTVCGLSNKKNQYYLAILKKEGAHVYNDTIDSIKKWRQQGKKTAVISASKNCRMVLSSTGITDLFDAIVDGVDSEQINIKGKPEPDIFLYAARMLNVTPQNSAIVEDSPAGIQAGKKGDFALVIGISRYNHASLLYNSGADIVVSSLDQIIDLTISTRNETANIPSALNNFNTVTSRLFFDKLLLLLDYDGTLTPIVSRPEQAQLSDTMKQVISTLATKIKVAIVSGRDLKDVKNLVSIKNLVYAGSHGFDIEGPNNLRMQPYAAQQLLPELDIAEEEAKNELHSISGIIIERKRFMVTVHYRLVNDNDITQIKEIMHTISSRHHSLIMTSGKKVYELRPDIPWDKGKAVSFIARVLFDSKQKTVPLYIGDDFTDEDAFREIKGWGISILVGEHGQKSFADYHLNNSGEVLQFLQKLVDIFPKT